MKPSIGRIVHYQQPVACQESLSAEERAAIPSFITRAAIVVGVKDVDGKTYPLLRVLCDYPAADFPVDCAPGGYRPEGIEETETPTTGCWNWPPRQ